jgi:hypothetical protein
MTDMRTHAAPPQTIEIMEQSEEAAARGETLASKLAGDGTAGYIDTIVNYDEEEGGLNIANVVKIGDQYITKEWQCSKDLQKVTGKRNRSLTRSNVGARRSFFEDDDALRVSRDIFENDFDQSVEPNPTLRGSSAGRKSIRSKFDHEDCDLCNQDEEVFFDKSLALSKGRRSLKRSDNGSVHRKTAYERTGEFKRSEVKNELQNNSRRSTNKRGSWNRSNGRNSRRSLKRTEEDFPQHHEISFNEQNRQSNVTPLKTSNLKRGRSSSPSRKSVSFHRKTVQEFDPRDSVFDNNRKSGSSNSPERLSASFARFDTPPIDDDFDEFDENFATPIPGEGNKRNVRSSVFSATKNKTASSTRGLNVNSKTRIATGHRSGYNTVTNNRLSNNRFSNSSVGKNYRMSETAGDGNRRSTVTSHMKSLNQRSPGRPSLTGRIDELEDDFRVSTHGGRLSNIYDQRNHSMKSLTKSERTIARNEDLKAMAVQMKRYGDLELQESKIRNTL